jgi:type II secretory pathway component PulJ
MTGAFSLLELLVATAVFIALALVLVSIAGSLSSFWQVGISHNERRSAALAAFSRMARDLRFAAAPINPNSTNFQLVINPTNVGTNYRLPQAAFWQAPVANDRSHGNMALVGYFVQWVNETNGSVPKLCRLLIDSTNFQFGKPSDWVNDALIASKAPANKAKDYDGQLAENVLGIWMQPLDQQTNAILKDSTNGTYTNGEFDSARGYTATLLNAGTNVTYSFSSALPASIEAVLVVTDARTARRLQGRPEEKPIIRPTTNMWDDVNAFYNALPPDIKPGARIYSTVINLQNAPR